MDKRPDSNLLRTQDLFRDTPIRLLGYANEVGESFRFIIGSKWVASTYAIATLYCVADTCHKTLKTYDEHKEDVGVIKKTLCTGTDTILWQMLASVVIPGYTINRLCALSNYVLNKTTSIPVAARKWIVPALGLSSIPFIVKPIDKLVDRIMDESFRKLVQ